MKNNNAKKPKVPDSEIRRRLIEQGLIREPEVKDDPGIQKQGAPGAVQKTGEAGKDERRQLLRNAGILLN